MQRLTIDQAVVISGFTGVLCCAFDALHEDIERRMGHPVFTHQLGAPTFVAQVKELYRADFLTMLPEAS